MASNLVSLRTAAQEINYDTFCVCQRTYEIKDFHLLEEIRLYSSVPTDFTVVGIDDYLDQNVTWQNFANKKKLDKFK